MANPDLRSTLLRIQDRLSDKDRESLHFFLSDDVPRGIRDDPTLKGTLNLMQSLFDQGKITEQDFTLLINAFKQIGCIDAVKLLEGIRLFSFIYKLFEKNSRNLYNKTKIPISYDFFIIFQTKIIYISGEKTNNV
jgi:hypothetical protein